MRSHRFIIPFLFLSVILASASCKKNASNNGTGNSNDQLSYGNSVLFLKNTSYTVLPLGSKTGSYSAFPDNLEINHSTGEITVKLKGNDGQSQTGLQYKISYHSLDGTEMDSTFISIAGVNYPDRFYRLSQNDSIIYPVYNADPSKTLPNANFDMSNDNKLAINAGNGQINIKESIRRGFFNDLEPNTKWKQTTIKYAVSDNSLSVANSLDIILYYYASMNDVPSNVSALMQAHQRMTLGFNQTAIPSTSAPVDNNLSSDLSLFKPRPPCVIIVGN